MQMFRLVNSYSYLNKLRKNITGANAPVIFSMLMQPAITMRNDAVATSDTTGHPVTMLSFSLLCRDNTSHHNAIPLLDQIEQDMTAALLHLAKHHFAVPLRNITLLYHCQTTPNMTLRYRHIPAPCYTIPTLLNTLPHVATPLHYQTMLSRLNYTKASHYCALQHRD